MQELDGPSEIDRPPTVPVPRVTAAFETLYTWPGHSECLHTLPLPVQAHRNPSTNHAHAPFLWLSRKVRRPADRICCRVRLNLTRYLHQSVGRPVTAKQAQESSTKRSQGGGPTTANENSNMTAINSFRSSAGQAPIHGAISRPGESVWTGARTLITDDEQRSSRERMIEVAPVV